MTEEIPPGGTEIPGPSWDPWRPEEAARRLDDAAVGWLSWALARVHPGHPWIGAIAGSS